ncbi:hypothetical protein SLEP1_g56671 [Rubroshorea leprosula]|uniref:Reverse transcriptase Ty1/copia-type domain-containing protein n=1 Tax=Rubroshorea leprosula TaxID=152421 RepID=A0AAV5MK76_9ROSI|nr:hypothetical protein SLEP1_g56671 [Rubroshorea leprosula]
MVCHCPVVGRSMLPPCATVPHHEVVPVSTKPAVPHSPISSSTPTSTPRSPTQSPSPTSNPTVTPTIAELDSSPPVSSNHTTSNNLSPPSPPPPIRTHPMVTRSQNNIFKPKTLHHATMASPLPSPEPTFSRRWPLKQLDVNNAFLHGDLDEELYMQQPTGFIDQTHPSHDLLQKSGMTEAKPVATPLASTSNLLLNTGVTLTDGSDYRKLVGSLQYLTLTRPDISFAVSRLSQFMHKPTDVHWQALKRVLRYLRGIASHGILLRPQQSLSIHAFSDANWAGDRDTCLSTTGYIVFLGGNPISWRAAKQHAVARSSNEAEYRALVVSSSELVWVIHLLNELGVPITNPPALYCDNVSATYLSSNPVLHSRMKHIAIDLHFVCDLVDKKILRISHIASTDQLANGFTKPLPSTRFLCLRDKIGVADGTSILQGHVKETKSVS